MNITESPLGILHIKNRECILTMLNLTLLREICKANNIKTTNGLYRTAMIKSITELKIDLLVFEKPHNICQQLGCLANAKFGKRRRSRCGLHKKIDDNYIKYNLCGVETCDEIVDENLLCEIHTSYNTQTETEPMQILQVQEPTLQVQEPLPPIPMLSHESDQRNDIITSHGYYLPNDPSIINGTFRNVILKKFKIALQREPKHVYNYASKGNKIHVINEKLFKSCWCGATPSYGFKHAIRCQSHKKPFDKHILSLIEAKPSRDNHRSIAPSTECDICPCCKKVEELVCVNAKKLCVCCMYLMP